MANYKATMIFNAEKAGWSESFYAVGGLPTSVMDDLKNLATVRAACLGSGAFIEALKVSDEAIPGDATFYSAIFKGNLPVKTNTNVRDSPWQSYLVRLQAGPLYRRMWHVRAVPDAWVEFDPATLGSKVAPDAVKAFGDLIAELKARAWKLRVNNKDQNANPKQFIQEITRDANGNMVMTLPNALVMAVNAHFRLIGVKGFALDGIRKRGTVVDKVNNLYTTNITLPATFTYTRTGYAQPEQLIYVPVDSGVVIRPGKRNVGRAFFVPAGRRKVRVTVR